MKKVPRKITVELLMEMAGSCSEVGRFARIWRKGCVLSRKTIDKAIEKGLDVCWFLSMLSTAREDQAFRHPFEDRQDARRVKRSDAFSHISALRGLWPEADTSLDVVADVVKRASEKAERRICLEMTRAAGEKLLRAAYSRRGKKMK